VSSSGRGGFKLAVNWSSVGGTSSFSRAGGLAIKTAMSGQSEGEQTASVDFAFDAYSETRRVRLAELHWYEAHGIGKKEFKRKKYLD
jgi:hypothetical protein